MKTTFTHTNITKMIGVVVAFVFIFTLSNTYAGTINSVKPGNYNNPNTWDCHCMPKTKDDININFGHTVIITSPVNINSVHIRNNALLRIAGTNADLNVKGDWTNDGSFIHGNAKVKMKGSGTQEIGGNNKTVFYELEVNQRGNSMTISNEVVLSANVDIDKKLTLTKGIIKTSDTEKLKITSSGDIDLGTNNSHIDGPVYIDTDDIKEIVIGTGKNGKGKKTKIKTEDTDPSQYRIEYMDDTYQNNNLTADLDDVCVEGYWKIERIAGNSGLTITMYWDNSQSCGIVSNKANARVARFNGSGWENAGNTDADGNPIAGYVSSSQLNNFGLFTVGIKNGGGNGKMDFNVYQNEDGENNVSDDFTPFTLSSYPNPTDGNNLNIMIVGEISTPIELRIVDMVGNQVYQKTFYLDGNNQTITNNEIGTFSSGVYMVVASSNDNVYQNKVIIQ